MPETYDVIVLGVGGFGSAVLLHLARRGLRVLGLEQFGIAHDKGSSHGEMRIIRKAYFEHPDYVPLLRRTYELWRELEDEAAITLYNECGLFLAGPPTGAAVAGARESARLHSLKLDDVPLSDARRRFPQFTFQDDHEVVFEHQSGYLHVEACVLNHFLQADAEGAECRQQTVRRWDANGSSVHVVTDEGSYEAGSLVVTAGAWSGRMLADLGLPLTVLRKVQFWHRTHAAEWLELPAFLFEQAEGCFYGFPAKVQSAAQDTLALKLAEHTGGEVVADPTFLDRSLRPHDAEATRAFIARTLRNVDLAPLRYSVCMYTMTPDGHFIVDRHPEYANVLFAAGFSGHGFKFAPVIGEALADLVVAGTTALPIGFLRLNRDGLPPSSVPRPT